MQKIYGDPLPWKVGGGFSRDDSPPRRWDIRPQLYALLYIQKHNWKLVDLLGGIYPPELILYHLYNYIYIYPKLEL